MTIDPKIWTFPALSVSKQLFHVPGISLEGGITSGGARIVTPEPGGFAMLDMYLGLSFEVENPVCSWLMSKLNGEIFRIRLGHTPQVITSANIAVPTNGYGNVNPNGVIKQDLVSHYTAVALAGSTTVKVAMAPFGAILKPGHVVGHGDNCYLVDEIAYDAALIATITVKPPLRNPIAIDDPTLFRPNFLGVISNGSEMRAAYDAELAGHMQLENIVFNEAVL